MSQSPTEPPPNDRWRCWLESHGRVFFLYARQQTRCESDAKDVFQEALVETWTKAGGQVPAKPVVLATIRRRAIDLGRSIDRRSRREQEVAGRDSGDWFVPDFSAGDTRDCLAAAVAALPDEQREVLILRIWGDLSFPAIASLTGVPVATATSRFRYALAQLRKSLAELQP